MKIFPFIKDGREYKTRRQDNVVIAHDYGGLCHHISTHGGGLNISGHGETLPKAIDCFKETMQSVWENIALEDDSALTPKAQEWKRDLLMAFEVVELKPQRETANTTVRSEKASSIPINATEIAAQMLEAPEPLNLELLAIIADILGQGAYATELIAYYKKVVAELGNPKP